MAARVLPSKVTLPKKNQLSQTNKASSIHRREPTSTMHNVRICFCVKMGPSFPGFPEFMIMRNCYWEKYPSVKRSFLLWNLCNDLHMHLISWRTGLLLFRLTNLKLKHDKRNGTKRWIFYRLTWVLNVETQRSLFSESYPGKFLTERPNLAKRDKREPWRTNPPK